MTARSNPRTLAITTLAVAGAALSMGSVVAAGTTCIPGPGAKCSGMDMRGMNLDGMDMRGMDMRGANMSGMVVTGADMSGAKMAGADMSDMVMTSMAMNRTDMSGTDMSGTRIDGGSWTKANFTGATMRGTVVVSAGMNGARFTRVNRPASKKRSANEANVKSAHQFQGAAGLVFNGTNLSNTTWSNANAHLSTFQDTIWKNARISGSNFSNAGFTGTTHWFWTVNISSSDFSYTIMGPSIEAARSVTQTSFNNATCWGKKASQAWGATGAAFNSATNTTCVVRGVS